MPTFNPTPVSVRPASRSTIGFDLSLLPRLLSAVEAAGVRWMHFEKLPHFDSTQGYTKAQGEA
jgi:hypothetical protein